MAASRWIRLNGGWIASTVPVCSASSSWKTPWFDSPAARILPSRLRSVKTCQYSSSGVPSSAGQCIWYRSIRSTRSRRSEASTSVLMLAGAPTRLGSADRSAGFQTRPPLVKT